jgi:MFS family permease
MFVVVPPLLVSAGLELSQHWKIYLPVVLVSFTLMIPAILYVDRRNRPKPVLLGAVALLVAVEAALGALNAGVAVLAALMLGFFVAFNLLEAMLPSLVSRIAPAEGRGIAIGVYNTTQTLGVFFGGLLGGWVAGHHGAAGVFYLCAGLSALWLAVAAGMRPVPLPGTRAVNGLSNAAL